MTDVIVIGGGPAGMMSAVAAGEMGVSVQLIDKNEKLGKKLFITGNGRCNVTNVADRAAYERKIFCNPRFMRSSLSRYTPQDLIKFLEDHKVAVKQEGSGRIFPASDKSSDIIRAFRNALRSNNVDVKLNTTVTSIEYATDSGFIVTTTDGKITGCSVVLATGGVSYPSTGSTGEGLRFAEKLGHQCVPLRPGLAGLVCTPPIPDLAGLTIRNGRVNLMYDGALLTEEEGDVLFTHYGLSGPAVFRAVCALADPEEYTGSLEILVNLAGDASETEIDALLAEYASEMGSSDVASIVSRVIPRRTVSYVLDLADVSPRKQGSQLSRPERNRIARMIVAFPMQVSGPRPIEEAIITIGGISVKEIYPSTMESKIVPGLFFAGEMIDVSAYTGGYNLQIAFSTGKAAGVGAAEYALEHRTVQDV